MKQKIAVISMHTCPLSRLGVMDAGGMNVYVLSLYKALAKKGYEIDIFTRYQGYEKEQIVRIDKNLRVIHIPGVETIAKKDLVFHIPRFWEELYTFISENKLTYHLVHSHYYLSALVGRKFSSQFSIPHVVTFHTTGIMKQLSGGKSEEVRIGLEKQITTEADQLIVSTPLEEEEVISNYNVSKDHISIVTPGVDHRIFRPRNKTTVRKKLSIPPNRKVIVFVGRIDPIKGISVLIDALGKLRKKERTFHECVCTYLIGGDIEKDEFWQIPEVIKIQHMIQKNNIDCCVEFIGAKPHEELALYYAASDIVVAPSFYESFGLSTLEAFSSGATVVASRVGGLQFLITDHENGLLFESKNSYDLVEKLGFLLNHEEECKRLGQNAYTFSQQFSWEKQAVRIAEIYDNLFHSSR